MNLLGGFLLGLVLLAGSALFWFKVAAVLPARYVVPLWFTVPCHQFVALCAVFWLGVTPDQGWFAFTLLLAVLLLLSALVLLPLFTFCRYVALCNPLQDKI